jgi:D-serine deaminase-like pyridoxal phosphate-dependent protein
VPVAIDLDMSTRFPGLHFGVRRSPVWDAAGALALAEVVARTPRVRLDGVMGYEAQIAGLRDRTPGQAARSAVVRALKRRSDRELRSRRAAIVAALRSAGTCCGSSTAAGRAASRRPGTTRSVTELAAGSGLYGPVLFDGYDAFECCRRRASRCRWCGGRSLGSTRVTAGGWIASGARGRTGCRGRTCRRSARLLPTEGAGEVQTPIACDTVLGLGDPVFFRHAKAGELCEHVRELVLLTPDGGRERVPTYRGDGFCFA